MTAHVIKLPDVGEGVAQAEIVEWHVAAGDRVEEDQILTAVMTDKATVEIPSPVAGTVLARGGEIGAILAVGAMLVTIDTENGVGAGAPAEMPSQAEPPARPAPSASSSPISRAPQHDTTAAPAAPPPDVVREGRPLASPSVRARARELGIDLRRLRGSGPAGRITHDDLTATTNQPPQALRRRSAKEEIKLTGLRRVIAGKMAESTRRIAHFSYVEEVDVTALEELRTYLNDRRADGKPKLTILPFIVRALVRALEDFPEMNALYDDDNDVVTRHAAVDAGIAVQTPAGLMVPVLRHAEEHGLWTCAGEIRRLAEAARNGTATREELSGSTITITSLGELGGIVTTPVINRPEVAILGVNRIAVRPVWQGEHFVPRKMMNLSSSFDHRVIDGHNAALFIRRIKELLETPAAMYVE
jgi:2-oxoisovalerate dehydrogenase E2 component (dihydrolipoyl transacylase)